MNYVITFPANLNQINPLDDNIDVLVQLEDGRQYTFVVATPDNLKSLMRKDNLPYLRPGLPFLFVERLDEPSIRLLLDVLLKEGDALLRLYGEDWL